MSDKARVGDTFVLRRDGRTYRVTEVEENFVIAETLTEPKDTCCVRHSVVLNKFEEDDSSWFW